MLYTFLLYTHNYWRWAVVLLGLWAVFRAVTGWLGKKEWSGSDNAAGKYFTIAVDMQLLLGLVLWVVSPVIKGLLSNPEASTPLENFVVFQHGILMLVAVVLIHVGRARSKKSADYAKAHRNAAIFYGLGFIIMLTSIPWWRPMLRGL